MAEWRPMLASEETYTARLHIVPENPDNGAFLYREQKLEGLPRPHLDVVLDAAFTDSDSGKVYEAAAAVNGLFAIDFPAMAHPREVTPAWLSYEKQQLYLHALELGEDHEAQRSLRDWPDAHMRTTHFVTGEIDANGLPVLRSASKLCSSELITPYIGNRLSAFTTGTGKKNRTPAISAIIATAAKLELLPAPPPTPEMCADRRAIAALQLRVASGELPVNHHYLLSSYTADGHFIQPKDGISELPPILPEEAAMLQVRGTAVDKSGRLSKAAMLALVRLRVEACYPDSSELFTTYPARLPMTEEEIAVLQTKRSAELSGPLRTTNHRTLPPPSPEYMAALEKDWHRRELVRQESMRALRDRQ